MKITPVEKNGLEKRKTYSESCSFSSSVCAEETKALSGFYTEGNPLNCVHWTADSPTLETNKFFLHFQSVQEMLDTNFSYVIHNEGGVFVVTSLDFVTFLLHVGIVDLNLMDKLLPSKHS